MSETMSSSGDWAQYYQQNVSGSGQLVPPGRVSSGINPVSDSNPVPTTITSGNNLSSPHGSSAPSSSNLGNLSPDGRVSKPVRRRSRASRRTPTTLLNTDTTNFRAMVQQFTGGPTAPFASGPHPGGISGFSFGRQVQVNHPGNVLMPPGYRLQYQVQQAAQAQQQQQQQQYQQQNQGYMISLGNNIPGPGDGFFQRLGGNPRPNMEVSDGFGVENINNVSSQVPLHPPPVANPNPPRPGSNENRGNTFMF